MAGIHRKINMSKITELLTDFEIPFTTQGKNVSEGRVNIECPFCPDPSMHLGILQKQPSVCACWRCGRKNIRDILKELLPTENTTKLFYSLLSKQENEQQESFITKEKPLNKTIEMLPEAKPLTSRHKGYLIERGLHPENIINHWGILGTTYEGDYKFRIIIPIYHDNKLVSFQGRDITNRQEPKYKTCFNTYIKQYLYGLDFVVSDKIVIVEGVTDVWKIGKGKAVATFGIEFTQAQIKLIIEKDIKDVTIFYDSEPQAQTQALKLKGILEALDITCYNVVPPKGKDPASMDKEEIDKLLKELKRG